MAKELVPGPCEEDYEKEALVREGVSEEDVKKVQAVWKSIKEEVLTKLKRDASQGFLLMAEPLMVVRYLRAREGDVEEAAEMWRESQEWRKTRVPRALSECGSFEEGGETENLWTWGPHANPQDAKTLRAQLGARHGHSRRLKHVTADDGAPILIWRLGKFDIAGVAREDLSDALAMQQVANLEDALQTCREASFRNKRLVRARCVVDLDGVSVSASVRNFSLIKRLMGITKAYYPEVTASVTLINAPFGFQTIWRLVSLLLNDHMRSKVSIVGRDYASALKSHAHISNIHLLPKALGGTHSDSLLAPTLPVPLGAGDKLRKDPDPPFLSSSSTGSAAD